MEIAVRALVDLLRAGDPGMRERAARALGALAEVAAIPALAQALGSGDEGVRAAAERSLAALWEAASEADRAYLGTVALAGGSRSAVQASAEGAVGALAVIVAQGGVQERARAVRALAALGSPSARPVLMSALRDVAFEVRAEAVRALASAGTDPPGRPARGVAAVIRRAAHDPHEAVRAAAREGLASLGAVSEGEGGGAGAAALAARAALRERLRAAPVEEAAELLFARGRALAGRPIARAEWMDIARALRSSRAGERILEIVVGATRREQVLRALRLARASARPKRRGGGAAQGLPAPRDIHLLGPRWEEDLWYEDDDPYDWPHGAESWRAYTDPAQARFPGVLPVSEVEEVLASYTRRMATPATPADFTRLGARLSDAEQADLRAAVGTRFRLHDEVETFMVRHGLSDAVLEGGEPIRTGPELALLLLLDLHGGRRRGPGPAPAAPPVEWASVASWIVGRIVQPDHAPGDRDAVVLAFLRFLEEAPAAAAREVKEALGHIHDDWLPLLPWIHARRGDGAWRGLVQASLGSTLVHHDLRNNLADLPLLRPAEAGHSWIVPAHALLERGGGTLRRMDYPSFQVVSRPAVSLIRPETAAAIAEMARALDGAGAAVREASCHALLVALCSPGGAGAFAGLPEPLQMGIARAVEQGAIAFVVLDNVVFASAPEPVRIRRRHVRRFWAERPADAPADLAALRERFDEGRVKEGLVHALLDQIHAPWAADPALHAALKEGFIQALRTVAMTYGLGPVTTARPGEDPTLAARRLLDLLVQQVVHAPLELVQALGMAHDEGLPRLAGGHATALERRFRQVLRETSSSARLPGEVAEAPRVFSCRPLSKIAALERGELGRDCSSSSVPLRALSPHHVYYGIFDGETQLPGYMTVYEAWAEIGGGSEEGAPEGRRFPVLCLETINAPIPELDPIQEDLVLIFEAVARSRGLHPGLVLIMDIGTWNYPNGWLLQSGRRFRKGTPVRLSPADPLSWRLYQMTTSEAAYYSAFDADRRGDFRLLALFDPDLDRVQPENLEEALRIARTRPRELIVTARTAEGPVGFVSAYPDVR